MATMLKSAVGSLASCKAIRPKAVARSSVVVRAAANRPTWYPGATPPKHLDGTIPGDYGFDPLRLATNKEWLPWFREAELTNGRWAMAAVAGILFTDLFGLPKFWEAGAQPYAIGFVPLLAIEVVVMAVLEAKRYEGWKKTKSSGFLSFFPFDPLKLNSPQMQLKEIKNGRLAMLAFVGFCSQAAVRGLGPIDSLKLHLEDPTHNTIYSTSVGPETLLTVGLLSVWPIIIEATKSLGPKDGQESVPIFPWNEPWKESDNPIKP